MGAAYFGIVFLFIHVGKVSGFSYKIRPYDILNLLNYLVLFPKAYFIVNEHYKKIHRIHNNKSNIRKAFEKNGESFAQMQYAPAWNSHGGTDFLFEAVVQFFLYFLTYLLSVLILLIYFIKKILNKFSLYSAKCLHQTATEYYKIKPLEIIYWMPDFGRLF